jgi:transposase
MRATYSRKQGIEVFLGFYDVHADVLSGVFRQRKRIVEVADAFRRLRARYRHRRLYVIIDGLHQVHDPPRLLAICKRLRITLVFTPTEASFLSPIESHFGVLGRATYAGSDDPAHAVRRRRVYRYRTGGTTRLATPRTRSRGSAPSSWKGTSR